MLAHHVVLALPGGELDDLDAARGSELTDLRIKRLGAVGQHRGGGHRLAQVLADEPDHAKLALQLRHIHVAVDAVDALQLKHDVLPEHVGSRSG